MNVVLVQHGSQQSKKYCFEVPDSLLSKVQLRAEVVCDTRRGYTHGHIVSDVADGEAAEHMIAENGATLPLKSIFAVVDNVAIHGIRIPIWMELSKPNQYKIEKRKQELETYGCVRTKVRTDENGILQDGYTAYLACKNKGMDIIPVAI